MIMKKMIALSMAVLTFSVVAGPSETVLAQTQPAVVSENWKMPEKSARYKYIKSALLVVDASEDGADYDLTIYAIDDVTSISGTITAYKKTSSGTYTKVDSEKLSASGCELSEVGTLSTNGSGTYKIEFKGTVRTGSGSESITISKTTSY